MLYTPIQIKNLALKFPHKVCFEEFSTQVHQGERIAIIGRNGGGKTTLLDMLRGKSDHLDGEIKLPEGLTFGYVPQIVEEFESFSGGQRFNKALTQAIAMRPDVLLLDEPINHLDLNNRRSLMRMLQHFHGTLIVVSHDVELIRTCIDKIWHIDDGKVHIFAGNYDDYIREMSQKRASIEQELSVLNRQKDRTHDSLMQEQFRAKQSKLRGKKKAAEGYWPPIVVGAKKRQAQVTAGKKKSEIETKKQELMERLADLHLPEVIKPKFSLTSEDVGHRALVSISDGKVGYEETILRDVHLSLMSNERIAVLGDNGSGKSTLVKAILGDPKVIRGGQWLVPDAEKIGYLDQHYANLNYIKTVLQTINELRPDWLHADVRRHLNDFLFRKNEEVNARVSTLSGGERARLSLAMIAASTPRLLILDEITNNIDLETREHVVQVLKEYPGAMIVISHAEDFLEEIGVESMYCIKDGQLDKL